MPALPVQEGIPPAGREKRPRVEGDSSFPLTRGQGAAATESPPPGMTHTQRLEAAATEATATSDDEDDAVEMCAFDRVSRILSPCAPDTVINQLICMERKLHLATSEKDLQVRIKRSPTLDGLFLAGEVPVALLNLRSTLIESDDLCNERVTIRLQIEAVTALGLHILADHVGWGGLLISLTQFLDEREAFSQAEELIQDNYVSITDLSEICGTNVTVQLLAICHTGEMKAIMHDKACKL